MRILLFLFPLFLCAQENNTGSFISEYEYGEMLYNNPRGVSCQKCHGKAGEGKTIVHYQDIHGEKEIRGINIQNKTLSDMMSAVSNYHDVMPRYYLTKDEVKAIYKYIQKKKVKKNRS